MRTVIINHKRYTVERKFAMVANYYFTDKHGTAHLVYAEDVMGWAEDGISDIDHAIAYAREYGEYSEDGIFWWKTLTADEMASREWGLIP